MGYTFKTGDTVRVIAGPRIGNVCTITGCAITGIPVPEVAPYWKAWGIVPGMAVYMLDLSSLVSCGQVFALASWLVPHRDGDEKGEWTEELRRLCGVGQKKAVSA